MLAACLARPLSPLRSTVIHTARACCSSQATVDRLLSTGLEFGPAPESAQYAEAWLESRGRAFGMFIDGKFMREDHHDMAMCVSPSTGVELAVVANATDEDVDAAVEAARAAQPGWAALTAHQRSRHLYALARTLQKHHRLLAVVESMDQGKPLRETRDVDVPLCIRHFYNHAGWAQLMDKEPELKGMAPVGTVAAIMNFPLLMLAWKIAPALAMGNTVVLKPAPWTRLSAMLFAELCVEAGLPPGVVNILSGDNDMANYMAGHEGFDKLAFTGSTGIGQHLRRLTAGTGKTLTMELGGKSPFVVYDTADIDSAVEGIVNAIWFNAGQVCCAGSRLLVQENIADDLFARLKRRMSTLRVGNSLDKAIDVGSMADPVQVQRVDAFVSQAREQAADGVEVFQVPDIPDGPAFYPPTLITGLHSASPLVSEEIFGPVLVAQTFRSPAEAVTLANNTKYGLAATVYTELGELALDTAMKIKAGVVWLNCSNMFDAAAGFGGYKQSGFGREGGREGLFEYAKPAFLKRSGPKSIPSEDPSTSSWGKVDSSAPLPDLAVPAVPEPGVDRTQKMYIGGKQARPDGFYSRPVRGPDGMVLGQVADGNRKDIRNAVEAARKAQGEWGTRPAHGRAQVLMFLAENLNIRADEFAASIVAQTGCTDAQAAAEVDASVSRLFSYGAWADKYGGTVQQTTLWGLVVGANNPLGVIGIACPDKHPLLSMVSLMAPAISQGNSVIVLPSQEHPLCATDLYQVLETSDIPGGVVNIVTGDRDVLSRTLTDHHDVDGMWYFGGARGSQHVEYLSAGNLKRTFVDNGVSRDWFDASQGEGLEFIRHATQVKNVWIASGV